MAEKNTHKSRFLTIFICIFLSIIVIFGSVMGIVLAINDSKIAVKGGSVSMDEGVVNYFASTFKITYIAGLKSLGVSGVRDRDEFWASTSESGKSYGELLADEFAEYLSELVASNMIFNASYTLDSGDRRIINDTVEELLLVKADGDKAAFNSLASTYGFDYNSLLKAAEILYKAEVVQSLIYGSDGTNIISELADDFLNKYARVSLAFIRTDYKPIVDEATGAVTYKELLSFEIEERENKINELKSYIDNKNSGSSGDWISSSVFSEIFTSYEGDASISYYFLDRAEATQIFAEDMPEVVKVATELEIGEYGYAECFIPADSETKYEGFKATCFIYRSEPQMGAYLEGDNEFLSDFYSLAANHYFSISVKERAKDVVFTDRYAELINPVVIPVNNKLKINSWRV